MWSATLFAGAGWSRLGDPWWGELNEIADLYVGLESEPLGERWILSGWVAGAQEAVDGVGGMLNLGAGFRKSGRFRWYGQVLYGISDASSDLAVTAGISFGSEMTRRLRRGGLQ